MLEMTNESFAKLLRGLIAVAVRAAHPLIRRLLNRCEPQHWVNAAVCANEMFPLRSEAELCGPTAAV
jgi:hypothetical protein